MHRSDFLTHWTGKDIATDVVHLTADERQRYFARLKDTLTHGLWMTKPGERLVSAYNGHPASIELEPNMTCFTELRLSGAQPHFERYGLLGFVVRRKFVLERGGGPVFYTRQHDDDLLVACAARVFFWTAISAPGSVARELDAKDVDSAEDVRKAFMFLCAYFKGMSTHGTDDFAFLDENEWRIVQSGGHIDAGRIAKTGRERPFYRIPLTPTDLRMLVVPDDQVRAQTLDDDELRAWFGRTSIPILTTQEVRHL